MGKDYCLRERFSEMLLEWWLLGPGCGGGGLLRILGPHLSPIRLFPDGPQVSSVFFFFKKLQGDSNLQPLLKTPFKAEDPAWE